MKLINLAIHRNSAPAIGDNPPPFRPITPESAINVTLIMQFDDEMRALNFVSDTLKTIQHYKEN